MNEALSSTAVFNSLCLSKRSPTCVSRHAIDLKIIMSFMSAIHLRNFQLEVLRTVVMPNRYLPICHDVSIWFSLQLFDKDCLLSDLRLWAPRKICLLSVWKKGCPLWMLFGCKVLYEDVWDVDTRSRKASCL